MTQKLRITSEPGETARKPLRKQRSRGLANLYSLRPGLLTAVEGGSHRTVSQRLSKVRIGGAKATTAFVVVLISAAFAMGCAEDEQTQVNPGGDQTTIHDQVAERPSSGSEEKSRIESAGGEGSGQKVALEIEGSPKTEFSGMCTVGDEENAISGSVPERFSYNLENGQKLECEIRKEDEYAGDLRLILNSGNSRSVQQTKTSGGTIKLIYQNGRTSYSSSSSSNSVNQVISSSSSSSASSR